MGAKGKRLAVQRPALESGIATSGANTTVTDSVKRWGTNIYTGALVYLRPGMTTEEVRSVASNTGTAITVSAAWSTNPVAGDVFVVVRGVALTVNAGTNLNTSALALEAGGNLASVLTALRAGNGNGRTFSAVKVNATAAVFFLLKALAVGKTPKLHELVGTADTADTTIIIESASANIGTTPVALTGTMTLADNGGVVVPYRADDRGCLGPTTTGKALGLVTATGAFNGWAIVSTD